MKIEIIECVSESLLELLIYNAKNPAPDDVHSHRFVDWQNEMRIHIEEIAMNIIRSLDKRYRLKDY